MATKDQREGGAAADEDRPGADGGEAPARRPAKPDVYLDVPQLDVDELVLDVEDLRARVSLSVEVLDLVRLDVGADVALGSVHLDLKGVHAQAQLKVRLDHVAEIVARVLATVERNPEILEHALSTVDRAVAPVAEGGAAAVESAGAGTAAALERTGTGLESAVRRTGAGLDDAFRAVPATAERVTGAAGGERDRDAADKEGPKPRAKAKPRTAAEKQTSKPTAKKRAAKQQTPKRRTS